MKRKLAALETLMWIVAHKTPCNFAAVAHLEGTFTLDQLHTALEKLRAKHPLLAVKVGMDYRHTPWFVGHNVPDFSLREVRRTDENHWQDEVDHELHQPFPDDVGPLVRFVVVRDEQYTDFIIICHHVVADGLSGVYLLRDILQLIAEPQTVVEPLPLLPNLDELIALPAVPSIEMLKTATQTRARISISTSTFDKFATEELTPLPQLSEVPFAITTWAWSAAQSRQLIDHCKNLGISVHSAIATAFLRGFSEFRGDTPPFERRFSSAVNLRNRLNRAIGEDFGLYVTTQFVVSADCTPTRPFWELAADLHRSIQRQATQENLIAPHLALRQVVAAVTDESTPENDVDYDVSYDFAISNLGRLDFPTQYGTLTWQGLYAPIVNGYGDEKIIGLCTFGGRFFFNMVVNAAVMSLPEVEQVRDLAMGHVTGAL